MMRLALASVALLAASFPAAPDVSARGVSRARVAAALPASRALPRVLSPTPGNLALAEIGFRGPGRYRISSRRLHIVVRGAFGDDYMAAAWLGSRTGPRVLGLVVNRPSALMDPARVHLSLGWKGRLGSAFTHVV